MIACDALLGEDALDERAVGHGSFVEGHVVRHRATGTPFDRSSIDRDAPARVLQREHGVASDISGAAGDEDWDFAHGFSALAKASSEFQPRSGGARFPARERQDVSAFVISRSSLIFAVTAGSREPPSDL